MLVILTATLQGAPTVSAGVMRYGVVAAIAEALCVEMARTESTYSSVFRIKGLRLEGRPLGVATHHVL